MTTMENGTLRVGMESGVAVFTLSSEERANLLGDALVADLSEALRWLREQADLQGVLLSSASETFCAGTNLQSFLSPLDVAASHERARKVQRVFRELETCGFPVAAALTGSAIGGGLALALACHRRFAWNDRSLRLGFPEVTLGLVPGGGATQRLPRMIGLQGAIELILSGAVMGAAAAFEGGLVDELCPSRDAVMESALAWMEFQPPRTARWDRLGFRWPGPRPGSPRARELFLGAAAMLKKRNAGAWPAHSVALSTLHDGTLLEFDRGQEIEARAWVELATSKGSQDQIRTLWVGRRDLERRAVRARVKHPEVKSALVIGAGLMGAGMVPILARAGLEVSVLESDAERRKAVIESWSRRPDWVQLAERVDVLEDGTELGEVDWVFETLPEDLALKREVHLQLCPQLGEATVWASNTSALPIAALSEDSPMKARFLGMHFFTPVQNMPLVEIVQSEDAEQGALDRALWLARRMHKIPVVVRDGYGFCTSRIFSSYTLEAAQLVSEGVHPAVVEWAARRAGMVVSPLQVMDEVGLDLIARAFGASEPYVSKPSIEGNALLARMVEAGRLGRRAGMGFYEYPGGKRSGLWHGLEAWRKDGVDEDLTQLGERLLWAQVAEAAQVWGDGVLRCALDGDVAAVLGLGFAPQRGGPLAMLEQESLAAGIKHLQHLTDSFGERFAPCEALLALESEGGSLYPVTVVPS